ncbi:MAG: hypothetical protein K6F14_02985 [Clostridiales bacterium]|nr:hypothetical protein [Clostridiales bacterium]
MKKVLSIIVGLTLLLVTILGVNAVYYSITYTDLITDYGCECYVAYHNIHGSNYCAAQTNIVKSSPNVNNQMVKAAVQCVVEYTDGSYDIDSMTETTYNVASLVGVCIDVPEGKVVAEVIAEHHIFWNYSYVDTKTTYLFFGDNGYN